MLSRNQLVVFNWVLNFLIQILLDIFLALNEYDDTQNCNIYSHSKGGGGLGHFLRFISSYPLAAFRYCPYRITFTAFPASTGRIDDSIIHERPGNRLAFHIAPLKSSISTYFTTLESSFQWRCFFILTRKIFYLPLFCEVDLWM